MNVRSIKGRFSMATFLGQVRITILIFMRHTQAPASEPLPYAETKTAYQMSLFFDQCGDQYLGSAWRAAYLRYPMECHFPNNIFQEFSEIDADIKREKQSNPGKAAFPPEHILGLG